MHVVTPIGVHLLDQDTVWHAWDDDKLVELRLEDMTPSHRRALLAWLRREAPMLQQRRMDAVARQQRRGALSDVAFAAALVELVDVDPAAWIEQQPLVRRLAQMVVGRTPLHRRGLLRPRRWWR